LTAATVTPALLVARVLLVVLASRRAVTVVPVPSPAPRPAQTRLTCSFTFEAAHRLPWHPGKCAGLHGHSYRLDVTLAGPLDENGIVMDFDDLHAIVHGQVIDQWDHSDLNLVLDNPTAELLAQRAWELLAEAGLPLAGIRLWETPQSWVELIAQAEGDGVGPDGTGPDGGGEAGGDGGAKAGSTHGR
jgi:6-pyruvoyltetrahydropterin/6-carboxytetrahydropterin synthase